LRAKFEAKSEVRQKAKGKGRRKKTFALLRAAGSSGDSSTLVLEGRSVLVQGRNVLRPYELMIAARALAFNFCLSPVALCAQSMLPFSCP
jgi:hypothetical protein